VEIGRNRRAAQSQVSELFDVRGKTMTSTRIKMESLLELLVQDSISTGPEEASPAVDSESSLSQSELTSPNTMVVPSWTSEDGLPLLSVPYQF